MILNPRKSGPYNHNYLIYRDVLNNKNLYEYIARQMRLLPLTWAKEMDRKKWMKNNNLKYTFHRESLVNQFDLTDKIISCKHPYNKNNNAYLMCCIELILEQAEFLKELGKIRIYGKKEG